MPATTQSPTPAPAPLKQQRSRKAATNNAAAATQPHPGRAGSAGGILLEKPDSKRTMSSSTTKAAGQSKEAAPAAATPTPTSTPTSTSTKPRRKPRKLNKEPTSTSTPTTAKAPPDPSSELEALKSRIRSLESKVEDLYKTTDARPARSPRRRGKGRKNSSSTTTATLGTLSHEARAHEQSSANDDDADEELTRLEGELEGARRDLANYRPRSSRRADNDDDDDDDGVEEVPRSPTAAKHPDRHVTLSGSYRIPLPASVNMDDVKTIQSGVSAAQSVARRVLEQRRAAAAAAASAAQTPLQAQAQGLEVVGEGAAPPGKKGWGEWIGGYSMAISRAVKSIEHEAAMEGQGRGQGQSGGGGGARTKAQGARKRPAAPRTALSGEQVQGLMG